MKLAIWVAASVFFLLASGTILLRSTQAPLALEPAPNSAPAAAEPEPSAPTTLSTEEFRTLGAELMRTLPRRKGSTKVNGDVSLPLVFAEERLVTVAEAVRNEPALEEDALLLYRECAQAEQFPDTVRALCFLYLRSLAALTGKNLPRTSVPYEIRALGEKLLN